MGPTGQDEVVILLATYNGGRFLGDQLRSFVCQRHSNWSLIVSDDGSSDNTLHLVEQFRDDVSNHVSIRQGPGLGFWRNFLSLLHRDSTGHYFAFSDQDDIWLPEKLTNAVGFLKTVDPAIPAVYFTRTQLIDDDGKVIGMSRLFCRPPAFRNALVQNIGGGNTMVMNRAAYVLLNAVPSDIEIVSHDWWIYQIVTGAGGIAKYDPEPGVQYRQHIRNIVGSNMGLSARFARLHALMRGRITVWNDTNVAALNRVRHLLTPDNRIVLDRFMKARRARLLLKPIYLRKAGVYRQDLFETAGLYASAFLGRI
jgi:glycosyltransferase involved in cell wall biosynthesis